MTSEQLIERLRFEADQETRSGIARRYGFSVSYIARVLDEEAPISEKLGERMGFTRTTVWVPLKRGA